MLYYVPTDAKRGRVPIVGREWGGWLEQGCLKRREELWCLVCLP